MKLANDFVQELNIIKGSITSNMSTDELGCKVIELESLINKYDAANNQLSSDNKKKAGSGRLAENFKNFKDQLSQLKEIYQK